jgi:multiple sugar transport system substrate-binding protein
MTIVVWVTQIVGWYGQSIKAALRDAEPFRPGNPHMTRKRFVVAVAGVLAGTVALTACGGSDAGSSSSSQNAEAKEVTLTITSNSISGGKNAAGADWITST